MKCPPTGVPENGPFQLRRLPLASPTSSPPPYLSAGPRRVCSASWVAVTARSRAQQGDHLAPPPVAAGPRRDALRCPAGREGKEGELSRGQGAGTAPRSSSAPGRPRPSALRRPRGLGAASLRGPRSPFAGNSPEDAPTFSRGVVCRFGAICAFTVSGFIFKA